MSDKNKTELAYRRGQLAASLWDVDLCLSTATDYLRILLRDAYKMTPEKIQTALCAIEAQRLDILVPLQAAMVQLQNVIRLTPEAELPVFCSPYALRKNRGISNKSAPLDTVQGEEPPPAPAAATRAAAATEKALHGELTIVNGDQSYEHPARPTHRGSG